MIVEKAIKVLLFEKMEYYYNEMNKYLEWTAKTDTHKDYNQGIMRQNASQLCAIAETIGIIENTSEDVALAEFYDWLKTKEA